MSTNHLQIGSCWLTLWFRTTSRFFLRKISLKNEKSLNCFHFSEIQAPKMVTEKIFLWELVGGNPACRSEESLVWTSRALSRIYGLSEVQCEETIYDFLRKSFRQVEVAHWEFNGRNVVGGFGEKWMFKSKGSFTKSSFWHFGLTNLGTRKKLMIL